MQQPGGGHPAMILAKGNLPPKGTEMSKPYVRVSPGRHRMREADGAHGAFEAEMIFQGYSPRTETEVSVCDVATLPMVVRRRKMYDGDEPVQLAVTYIDRDLALKAGLDKADTGPGGMLSRLADIGCPVVAFREEISVCIPDEDEQAFFGSGELMYRIHRMALGQDDLLLETTQITRPVKDVTLVYEFPA